MGTEPRDEGEPGMPEPLGDGSGDNDGTGNGDNGGGEAADDVFPPGWGAGLAPVLVIDAIVVVGSLPLIWFTPWDVSPGFWFAGALVRSSFWFS